MMMKKWMAVLLALAMMLCFAGCGSETTDTPVSAQTPAEETAEPENELSFPVTVRLENSDELMNFIDCINSGTAVTYENVMEENGQQITYTLTYNGMSCLLEASMMQDGEELTASDYVAQFGMAPLKLMYTDMFGGFDEAAYVAKLESMGLSMWMDSSREALDENLCIVYAVLSQGSLIVFDYYVNTPVG